MTAGFDYRELTFTDYALATDKTAIYPGAGHGSSHALAYVGLGLGEAGEVQNQIKKVLRDDDGVITQERREAISAELGDLLWYAARVARELHLDLGMVAKDNLVKLASRKSRDVIKGSGDTR